MDKLSNMGAIRYTGVRPVMVRIMDAESLCQAFDGCAGVFHTSSSLDLGGISGYSVCSLMLEQEQIGQIESTCPNYRSKRENFIV